jgi:ankyrin repeat protein
LVKYDAPVEAVESLDKQTALIFAAKNGYVDCVRVLVEEGKSNPEKGDRFLRTPLHYACINGHIEVVKYLLSHGVNANAADSSNNTPIHFAAAFGYIKILHLLVEYGSADPSVCNVWRSTPCSVANMKGHIAIVKYLLNLPNTSIDVNFKDQEGCVMLQNNINEPVDTLLEMNSNVEKISLLLSMNADVNSVDLEGNLFHMF